MTCFLMDAPRAVFIHIPKTAGTSVRAMWATDSVRRCFGHVPNDWKDVAKFAVVRDPEARLVSALSMFKHGSTGPDGAGEAARMPDLSVDEALDIVENPSIPFDRMQKTLKGNLKHHLLPQTHPYNCLHLADLVLRQETLAQDVKGLELDGLRPFPHLRQTKGQGHEIALTDEQRTRLHRVFAQDYEHLGYRHDGTIVGECAPAFAGPDGVWPLWPAFFSDQDIRVDQASSALPADEVDLQPFVEDMIFGVPKSTWPGRSDNLIEHFQKLLPECVGQARIVHLAACCIVTIRKTHGSGPGLLLFHRILAEHSDVVFADMSSRWLCSVADTLADHGQHPAQQALGLCASVLAAAVKLSETERLIYAVPRPWPPNARFGEDRVMFDGVISFWDEKGDMIDNLLDRVSKAEELDPIGGQLVAEMVSRVLRNDTVFRRMAELSDRADVPYISDEIRARLMRIARNRL